jgi:A/G-specific adenine glycosylase
LPNNSFSALILAWYDQNKRELPWRQTSEPYKIWLSEIILQQTRVAQGLPYYQRFIAKYPTVDKLAGAAESEVLRLWQGLGYYSRARNLHKCARVVVHDHDGQFPATMAGLKQLPGVGNYTAAAIASLAFNEPVPVVDGNVYRLLARYLGIETDISSSSAFRQFYDLALALIDTSRPGDFNQAMMEFGAIQCTPKNPQCEVCPLQSGCLAYARKAQQMLPVKLKKTKVRQRYFHYFLIRKENKMLLRQRREKDIWQGLFELPLIESAKKVTLNQIEHPLLDQLANKQPVYQLEDKIHRHVLSHQVLNVNFVVINIKDSLISSPEFKEYRWYSFAEAEELPKPVLIANYLDSYLNSIDLQEEKN